MASKLVKSKIKLTIGMLVSNHVQYIRNCMEAIQPLLKAVPSELIVIDTKGEETDGSIAIVREYTDKIYPFIWCNDFSAARNTILEHANGEWFLYFDDDEWFDDVQEFIDFFQSGECEKYYSGFYYTRDYAADGSYSMGIAGRMIRRTETTCFVGKVHETFNEVFSPGKIFSCFTHHYGYAFATEESKRLHQERNVSILRGELEEYGKTPRLCAQLTQELMYLDSTREEGLRFCLESIDALEKAEQLQDSCSQWLLVASARFYAAKKDYAGLKKQAELLRNKYSLTQMATLALAATVIRMAAAEGDCEAIDFYVPLYLEMKEWLQEHPEEKLLQIQLDFPRYDTEQYLISTLYAGAVSANRGGRFEQAYTYWKQLPWEKEQNKATYREDLLVTLRGLSDKEPLIQYYKQFYKEECFLPENQGYLPKECRELLERVTSKKQ